MNHKKNYRRCNFKTAIINNFTFYCYIPNYQETKLQNTNKKTPIVS